LVRLVLLGDAVRLDLEVDVVGPVDLHEVVDVGARLGRVVLDDPAAEPRLEAAGERDHVLRVARQQPEVDVGLAPLVALEEAGRAELHQVAEALVAARQQREVVALVADRLGLHVVDQVGLEAQNRLDSRLLAGLVELDRPVHHPVVGEPDGRLAEGRRPLHEGVDLRGAVEQRVLGVDVQMYGRALGHRVPLWSWARSDSRGRRSVPANCGKSLLADYSSPLPDFAAKTPPTSTSAITLAAPSFVRFFAIAFFAFFMWTRRVFQTSQPRSSYPRLFMT